MCDKACFQQAPPRSAKELLAEAERRKKEREASKAAEQFMREYVR